LVAGRRIYGARACAANLALQRATAAKKLTTGTLTDEECRQKGGYAREDQLNNQSYQGPSLLPPAALRDRPAFCKGAIAGSVPARASLNKLLGNTDIGLRDAGRAAPECERCRAVDLALE